MTTLNQRVSQLLQRYADSACTPDEFNELLALLRLDPDGPEIDAVLERAWEVSTAHPAETDVDWEQMRLEILRREPPAMPVRRLWPFRRITAAAVIGVLLTGATWWALHRKTPEPAVVQQVKADALPGGNKAILTLGNGQIIVLDSAANGVVAQQGNTSIEKKVNGRLEYQSTGGVGGFAPHNPNARTPQADAHTVYNTLATPRGGQYQLTLPDGTKVWLNAASSITYPTAFVGATREVTITGEAYFEVMHQAHQPFHVRVGQETIEDLGTTFDVNAYSDEPGLATTLVNGSVRVSSAAASLILKPGQQATQRPGGSLQLNPSADVDKVTAWTSGHFLFDRDELPAIMRQLSRWYDLDVEFRGTPGAAHFSGIISRSKNLSQVLNMLKATQDIHFTIENKKLIITP